MKKFLVLVALAATTSLCWALPVTNGLSDVKPLTGGIKATSLSNTATVFNNFILPTKDGDEFQQGDTESEVISPRDILGGQLNEMGPRVNYNIVYEPITQTIWTLSCSRYINTTGDSVMRLGEVRCLPYIRNQKLEMYTKYFWNEIWEDKDVLPIVREEWRYPSIIVANPTGSTDPKELKIGAGVLHYQWPSNGNWGDQFIDGTWFGVAKTTNLFDETSNFLEHKGITLYEARLTTGDEGQYYLLYQNVKGHTAYFNGDPYAVYFTKLFHSDNAGAEPIRYALISINLNKTDDRLSDGIEKWQILPESVHKDIFSNITLAPDNRTMNAQCGDQMMNIDSDNNNNIYLGFNGVTKKIYESDTLAAGYNWTPTPVVIKVPYEANEDDVINGKHIIDSMPMQVWGDYINEQGGIWTPKLPANAPRFTVYRNDNADDLPFVVVEEDHYSFLGHVWYNISDDEGTIDLVELRGKNGQWKITKIANVDMWGGANSLNGAVYSNNGAWNYYTAGLFYDSTVAQHSPTGINRYDQQISVTPDKEYIIAKWIETDAQQHKVKLSSPITHWVTPWLSTPEVGWNRFQVTTDEIFYSVIKLSYRRKNDDVWSEPIEIKGNMNDSISFRSTFMPRIVPSIEDVIISYTYSARQPNTSITPNQNSFHPLIATGYMGTWQRGGLISVNAKNGSFNTYSNIKEEGPSEANQLSISPNPNPTNFGFSLLSPGNARLTIQNSLGQEVAVLVNNEHCNASDYSVDYDISNLPVGVYYLTLTSGTFIQTKAFTVVR